MAKVNNQVAPLKTTVERLSGNLDRLYNTNGGPPGFLQTARKEDERMRAEDQKTFAKVFDTLKEHKDDMKPLKDYIRAQEIREEQRERDRRASERERREVEEKREKERIAAEGEIASRLAESDRRFDHKVKIIGIAVGVFGLFLTVITIAFGIWNHHPS